MGTFARDTIAVEDNIAGSKGIDACQAVEYRGFTGTIWADQTVDSALFDVKRDRLSGLYTTEVFGD